MHELRQPAPLHANGATLRTQPLAVACRARSEGSIRLERFLIRPGPIVEPAPQARDDALEVRPERIARPSTAARGLGPPSGRTEQDDVAKLLRQPGERDVGIDAERPLQSVQHLAEQPSVAVEPRRDGAVAQRSRVVGDDPARVEIVDGAEPLAVGAGAVRRVERERPWSHLGDADPAHGAGEPPREEAVPAPERVDHDDIVGQLERQVDGIGQPSLDARLDDQPVHEHVDRVVPPAIERDVVVQGDEFAIDARTREASGPKRGQLLPELPLAASHDRREHVDPLVGRIEHHHVDDAFERLRRDLAVAVRAVGHADIREEQPQVIVDLGHRPDGGPRIRAGRLLFDGNGRREAVDQVDVRLLHLLEKLPGVGRQRLDVPALSLGVDRVEGERRLSGARQSRDDDEPIARNVDVDVAQVVNAGPSHDDPVVRHGDGRASSDEAQTAILTGGTSARRGGASTRAPDVDGQNLKLAPPGPGIGTSTTLVRSWTIELSPVVLLRQFPAQAKNPIVSPTAGWWPLIGPQRLGS